MIARPCCAARRATPPLGSCSERPVGTAGGVQLCWVHLAVHRNGLAKLAQILEGRRASYNAPPAPAEQPLLRVVPKAEGA